MQRRSVCVMVLALAAATACEHKTTERATGLGIPTRAPAVGDLPDNPMLGAIPSDTPYAFVSFRPFPLELMQKFGAVMGPVFRKAFANTPKGEPADEAIRKDLLDVVSHLDVATIEAQGLSSTARIAFYGLGAYPVMRFEIKDGDKVFALVQRVAERWNKPLPAPLARAGGRYWQIDEVPVSAVFAILPKEIVVAVAPKDALEAELAMVLGEQKPPQAMTTAQFRAIAERDGFSGLAIGFADVARIAGLVAKLTPAQGCGEALAGLARRVPRLTTGYGELSVDKMTFGMVAELAPEVLAEARGLTGKLAGLELLLASKPMMAFAAALDVEHARLAAGHAATVVADVALRCEAQALVTGAQKAVATLARPLPPFVGGLHGGYMVVNKFNPEAHGPESVEGFGSLQIEQPAELIKLAQMAVPGLDLPSDGKPHALPQEAKVKGHAAVNDHAIGFGLGATSEADAVRGLAGTPIPAPLFVMAFDYRQFGKLIPLSAMDNPAMSREDMQRMFDLIGTIVMQIVIDDRGVVVWSSTNMK